MKKSILMFLVFTLCCCYAYAADIPLLNVRDKFLAQAAEIKPLMATSRNALLVSSMWDACVMVSYQLNAYFYMVGIFEATAKGAATQEQIDFIISWLNDIRRTNDLNINSLKNTNITLEKKSQEQLEKLLVNFNNANTQIGKELQRVKAFKKKLKPK